MKGKRFVTLLILGSLIGCKHDSLPASNPDLTADLTGIYTLYSFQEGEEVIPIPTATTSAYYETSKVDYTRLLAKLIIVKLGQSTEYSRNVFALARDRSDASKYNVDVDGKPIGFMTATVIEVSDGMHNGVSKLIKAKRQ
ncbi:hypothetical protein GCM10027578_04870 [Spirosoma luteolum]